MVSEKVVVAVIAPEVPVTVIVEVPVVAVDEAEIAAVTWHGAVGVHGLLVNNTVTPEGRADSETVTENGRPSRRERVKISVVAVSLEKKSVESFEGAEEGERVKAMAGMERCKVVVAVIAPEVPVTVIVEVPVVAVDEAEIAAVTWHGAVGVHGLLVNNTVTPEGRADSETVTGEATPVRVVDRKSVV